MEELMYRMNHDQNEQLSSLTWETNKNIYENRHITIDEAFSQVSRSVIFEIVFVKFQYTIFCVLYEFQMRMANDDGLKKKSCG